MLWVVFSNDEPKDAMMQIVLARLDDDAEVIKVGRSDLGEMHTFRAVKKPVALMWATHGGESDKARAERFANSEGYTVFCYDAEEEPLDRARREIAA